MKPELLSGRAAPRVPNFQRCVYTFSGQYVDIFDPDPVSIKIVDIAHHLSIINRLNGATRTPYSYAQHSVFVMNAVRPEDRLAALLHDAAKAYTFGHRNVEGRAITKDAEAYLQAVINNRFGLGMVLSDERRDMIRKANLMALATERRDLLPPDRIEWPILHGISPLASRIRPQSAAAAESEFMSNFKTLTGMM